MISWQCSGAPFPSKVLQRFGRRSSLVRFSDFPSGSLAQDTHLRTFQDYIRRDDPVHGPIVFMDWHFTSGKELLIKAQRH